MAASTAILAASLVSGDLPLLDYIARLEANFAAREAQVQAFVPEPGRFDRLRRQAVELCARYPDPNARPPLFGLPVGVKDIFHVDGFPTRAGSRLPPEVLQGSEAASVTVLKQAGALILGKTVTTEFAYFGPGPTRNPHNLERTPGGSSSGSAAAVAAGLCPLALGTQTIGSLIRPGAFCGVVVFKATYERISRAGVIPLSPSVDHVGVFAADVAGVRLAAGLLCQGWRALAAPTSARPALGVPEGPYLECASPEGLEHFRRVCQQLADAGYAVKPVAAMPDFAQIRERHEVIVSAECAAVHRDWFARFGDLYHPKTVELIRRGQPVTEAELAEARPGRESLRAELTALMDEHGLDAWIAPSAPGPAPKGIESTGDPVMNLPWTQAGLPALNLPAGANAGGLPLGLQVVGRWGEDESLLAWAGPLESVVSRGQAARE